VNCSQGDRTHEGFLKFDMTLAVAWRRMGGYELALVPPVPMFAQFFTRSKQGSLRVLKEDGLDAA